MSKAAMPSPLPSAGRDTIQIRCRRSVGGAGVNRRRTGLELKISRCSTDKLRISRDVAVRSRLVRTGTAVGETCRGYDVIESEYRRAGIEGPADDRGLSISGNEDIVDQLSLRIETVGKNSRTLRTVVSGDRVVDEKRSSTSRWNQPVNTAAG